MTDSLVARRILVVEDELIVSWLLEDMLANLGCIVVGPAARVVQALEMVEALDIDAAVLDVCLNEQFSYPVADALIARRVPFIFATGYDRARLRHEYSSYSVLQKPFHASDLDAALLKLFPQAGQGIKTGTAVASVP